MDTNKKEDLNKAEEAIESVDLKVAIYEWTCPHCEHINEEIEILPNVQCMGCDSTFTVSGADHAQVK